MIPKVVYYKHKTLSKGKSPVCIQVTIDRKAVKKTLFNIEPNFWDDKRSRVKHLHPLAHEYNDLINSKLLEVERRIIECIKLDKPVTSAVLDKYSGSITIIDALIGYREDMKLRGKYTAYKYDLLISNVADGLNGDLRSLNVDWFKRYKIKFKDLSQNTLSKHIRLFKTMLNFYFSKNMYFDQETITYKAPYKKTSKDKLTKDEFIRLKDIALSGGKLELTRDMFVFAVYCRGIRVSDTLSILKSDIKGGRLLLEARKSQKNMDIRLHQYALDIIDKYIDNKSEYLFPMMKLPKDNPRYKRQIEACTATINYNLKTLAVMCEIEKNITSHVARHTLAYLLDQSGQSIKRIQDILEHSDLNTTEIYISDLKRNDELDKTMDDFINSL